MERDVKTATETEGKAESEHPKGDGEKPASVAKAPEKTAGATVPPRVEDFVATVRRLEAFAADEARRVSGKLLPGVETRAKQNIWVTILFALGLGLILGLWANRHRRRE